MQEGGGNPCGARGVKPIATEWGRAPPSNALSPNCIPLSNAGREIDSRSGEIVMEVIVGMQYGKQSGKLITAAQGFIFVIRGTGIPPGGKNYTVRLYW